MERSESRDPLDELAESFLERRRRGENPSIEEYVERHPELRDAIRSLFPTLCVIEELAPDDDTWESDGTTRDGLPIRELGEYRLLREVGRGGMGIVFEAEQISLSRRVALKILPYKSVLDSTQLERFRLEARVAARLHHTNIVPVFGVGKDRGVHYYAMQFIRGHSLAEVLDELRRIRGRPAEPDARSCPASPRGLSVTGAARHLLSGIGSMPPTSSERASESQDLAASPELAAATPRSSDETASVTMGASPLDVSIDAESTGIHKSADETYWRSVARIGLQVAEALSYSHAEGILHRDIKPSNLLLDTRGTVWITDFGLAKSEGSDDLTAAGNLVGTIRYMAPERFRGDADARSDIYGLGITLYELLTLSPAFRDTNRAQLVRRVTEEEPVRPRRIDPSIPRDLETIVLKSIAKRPGSRYETAAALADDLRRFLDREPVAARRANALERGWRWCQRNPAVSLLSAVVVLLLLTLALGAVAAAWDLRRERNATVVNLGRALDAEAQAMRRLAEAKLEEGRAWRRFGGPGQRIRSIAALSEAAGYAPNREIRNELIGSFALADLSPIEEWSGDFGTTDPGLELSAHAEPDGTVIAHELGDPSRVVARIDAERPRIRSLTLDSTRRFLAVRAWTPPGEIDLWDLTANMRILTTTAAESHRGIGFARDGSLFAVSRPDGAIAIHRLPKGDEIARLPQSPVANHLVFSPDGRSLAIVPAQSSSRSLWIRSVPDGDLRARLAHAERVTDVAWHPQGKLLATACFDFDVHLWSGETFRRVRVLDGHVGEVYRVEFDPEGELLASTSWDGRTRLWNPWSGASLLVAWGNMLGFRERDGALGYQLGRRRYGLWRVERPTEYRLLPAPTGFRRDKGPRDVALSPDGLLIAAASLDGGLQIWNARCPRRRLDVPSDAIESVQFLPAGDGILTTGPSGTKLWPLSRSVREGNDERISSSGRALRQPTSLASSRRDEQAMGHDPSGLERTIEIGPPIAIGPPGEHISTDASGSIVSLVKQHEMAVYRLDRDERRLVDERRFPHPNVTRARLSASGRKLVSVTWHGRGVRVWSLVDRGRLEFELDHGSARAIFAPDESSIVICTGGTYELYDLDAREVRWRIDRSNAGDLPSGMAFAPNGDHLAIALSRDRVAILDVERGAEVAIIDPPPHTLDLNGLAWSADGGILVAGTIHQAIHWWDLRAVRRRLELLRLDWAPPLDRLATSPNEDCALGLRVAGNEAASEMHELSKPLPSDVSLRLLNELVEASNLPGDILRRARHLAGAGELLDALADYDSVIERVGAPPSLLLERSDLHARLGDLDRAFTDLARASSDPRLAGDTDRARLEELHLGLLRRRATERIARFALGDARADLEEIIERRPSDPEAAMLLAWLWALGETGERSVDHAVEWSRLATRARSDYFPWRVRALIEAFAGNPDEAKLATDEANARASALEDDWPHVDGIIQALLKLAEGAAGEALELARSTATRIDRNPPPLHARRSLDRLVEHVRARIEAARAE